jgi:hypothetical protein
MNTAMKNGLRSLGFLIAAALIVGSFYTMREAPKSLLRLDTPKPERVAGENGWTLARPASTTRTQPGQIPE